MQTRVPRIGPGLKCLVANDASSASHLQRGTPSAWMKRPHLNNRPRPQFFASRARVWRQS